MTIGIVEAVRTLMGLELNDNINFGGNTGRIRIYAAPRPVTVEDSPGGALLLAELFTSDPMFLNPLNAVFTADDITGDASANNDGEADWFRVSNTILGNMIDGDVRVSGGHLNLNTVAITTGVQVDIDSFVLTMGNP